MIFDPDEKIDIWMNKLDWKLLKWKLHENYGVHTLFMDGTPMQINMLVEKKYPLIKDLLEKMLNLQLEAEEESTMAFELLKFIKRHFKSLSLDELRSPDFNLFSNQEYSEEEEAEAMAETMEKYMSKTRTDYGSGVAWPKIEEKDNEMLYQAWERFKELLMKCPQHYLTEMQEVILFYNGLDVPTRQILDSRSVVPTKTAADAKKAIQEIAEYSQK
ncbi:hypothetical protein Tco_0091902 [Tanacetum coccineum]